MELGEKSKNNTGDSQNSTEVYKYLHPNEIEALGKVFNGALDQWKEIESHKAKNMYKFSLWNKSVHYVIVILLICLLTFLIYIGRISETIYSTLISSIIGYVIGGTVNNSRSSK